MKYKVGDKVRIKSIDWYNENKDEDGIVELSTHVFIPEMIEHCGQIVTIKDVFEDTDDNAVYYMEEIVWDWTDEMIEGIVEETTIKIKDLRKFINQMEIEGLNDETVLTFETKRSSGCIENITSMEYSPTTNILIFSKAMEE